MKGDDGASPDQKNPTKYCLVLVLSVPKLLEGRDRWKIWPWLYEIK